ncbi:ankyrin [Desulfobulbus rhabdoformis]|uniref:ankyrin n=1 Tax=Desulfobulbus rhabdoformis TaxID=34032 RepID=UPI001962BB62|nr:ankyrin [Desulfobulbus rhabdoformis]MBM9614257.1 ankyrin [Desulfobulbus rhabdoformis]
MSTPQNDQTVCPTCMGKKVISGVCETSSEWDGIKTPDQEECTSDSDCSGQVCTPDTQCPTCKGTGYV